MWKEKNRFAQHKTQAKQARQETTHDEHGLLQFKKNNAEL